MMTQFEYCKQKYEIIRMMRSRHRVYDAIKQLELIAPNYVQIDADIEWIKLYVDTKNFAKTMTVKKIQKRLSVINSLQSVGDDSFSKECDRKAQAYLNRCFTKTKKIKRTKICLSIVFAFILLLVCVGYFFCDSKGLFYGSRPITFEANGQIFTQNDAIKYNNFVQVKIPAKTGYDVVGIFDSLTNEKLFDSSGKSYKAVSNRKLLDFDSCELKVVYEPHVYTASVRAPYSNNNATTVTYTVETDPTDLLVAPQSLQGYEFVGWYTDSEYKHPFTGNFIDYTDDSNQIVFYPRYQLEEFAIEWDLQGGQFLYNIPVNHYDILTDIALPNADNVQRQGYLFQGWSIDGQQIDYFTPTIMRNITLTALWSPQQYAITIVSNFNSVRQNVTFDQPYFLSAQTVKGYEFIGFNVLNGEEFPSKGIYRFPFSLTLIANYTPCNYSITYIVEGKIYETQIVVYDKQYSFVVAPPRANFEFIGWYHKGEQFTEGIYCTPQNIVLEARYIETMNLDIKENATYFIPSDIDKVYIKGQYDVNAYVLKNVNVVINKRFKSLIIDLHNVAFKAPTQTSAIRSENEEFALKIVNTGQSAIVGGDGKNGQLFGESGGNGCPAIDAGSVSVCTKQSADTLTLKSGNGGCGADGRNGITAFCGIGGDHNGQDGGNGGNAGVAIKCVSYVSFGAVNLIIAEPGQGGKGGSSGWLVALIIPVPGTNGRLGNSGQKPLYAICYK